jgi:hypothetical protein
MWSLSARQTIRLPSGSNLAQQLRFLGRELFVRDDASRFELTKLLQGFYRVALGRGWRRLWGRLWRGLRRSILRLLSILWWWRILWRLLPVLRLRRRCLLLLEVSYLGILRFLLLLLLGRSSRRMAANHIGGASYGSGSHEPTTRSHDHPPQLGERLWLVNAIVASSLSAVKAFQVSDAERLSFRRPREV